MTMTLPRRIAPLLLLLLALPMLGGCLASISGPNADFREVLLQGEGSDKMLMIDIDGPIDNTPTLVPNLGVLPGMTARVRQELELAYQDPDIHGILLRINSPGGTLTDSDIIYHSLMEFKKTKKVKIVAAMEDIAASGALYVAMAADEIYAHPTTITGSIGVIMPHTNYSGLYRKLGIESDPVTSGPYKDLDNPAKPRDPAAVKLLQDLVNSQYQKFLDVVKAGRPQMSMAEVKKIADGRILSAQEAKQKGLIDHVGYLDDAYRRLSDLSGFPKNSLIRYANAWQTGNNIYSNTFPVELFGN
ncbi:MAG TPA: signal peptide peptidase SppA [bacterium]|nr:signal peptide peptidase SppA [bacterium]